MLKKRCLRSGRKIQPGEEGEKALHFGCGGAVGPADQGTLEMHLGVGEGNEAGAVCVEVAHGVGRYDGHSFILQAQLVAHADAVGFKDHLRLETCQAALAEDQLMEIELLVLDGHGLAAQLGNVYGIQAAQRIFPVDEKIERDIGQGFSVEAAFVR